MKTVALVVALVTALVAGLASSTARAQESAPATLLTEREQSLAREFSPLPPVPADPTNAYADDPRAARLGQAFFYDPGFSGPGDVSCSTCHEPDLGWGDGKPLAHTIELHTRHSPTLLNVAYNRWFFWDGRKDSLWSQALDPIEDPREHAFSRLGVAHRIAAIPSYAQAYTELFGPLPELSDTRRFPLAGRPVDKQPEHPHAQAWDSMAIADQRQVDEVYVHFGKAVAAFERQILSTRSPFDVFVEGLDDGDPQKLAALSESAQRGFSLFVGKGQCLICHDGPNFTDLEFHSNRAPTKKLDDGGRAMGIQDLKNDPFNLRSQYADDGGRLGKTRLSIAPRSLHFPGDFKTPTLRNVARTGPYMHEGQMATLGEVVSFYSTLEGAGPPDPTGENLIQPRSLSLQEQADLVAFLESLTDEHLPPELRGPPPGLGPAR